MATPNPISKPTADFVTSTLSGAITAADTSATIGTGLNLPATNGVLQIDYDSTIAVGTDEGPETICYTGYNSGTGALTGVTRGEGGTTAVAHSNGSSVQQAASSVWFGNAILTHTDLPTGACVQEVDVLSGAVATTTAAIPFDDTVPQITEGGEFLTLAITPKSATNKLVIEVLAYVTNNAAGKGTIGALFQDSTAGALAAAVIDPITGIVAGGMMTIRHTMTAGTTSATTFKFRCGSETAGNTITLNGNAGGRNFGAITKSSMIIREYKA